ncbi:MAG: ATP-dependent metallopeptidase FtsH/Yme1/Tma family protein, partial [Candidatus Binatia bacterium]
MWYVLGFLILAGLVQGVLYSLQTGRAVEYSEFKSLVRAGRVQDVVVADERIRGTLKQADEQGRKAFVTVRIEDPKLIEDLERHGVRYSGELTSRWAGELLSWIIPLLFIIGLWSIFFRRMGGAEGGIMSFARSRAKVFVDDDVKVSFADVAGVE